MSKIIENPLTKNDLKKLHQLILDFGWEYSDLLPSYDSGIEFEADKISVDEFLEAVLEAIKSKENKNENS